MPAITDLHIGRYRRTSGLISDCREPIQRVG